MWVDVIDSPEIVQEIPLLLFFFGLSFLLGGLTSKVAVLGVKAALVQIRGEMSRLQWLVHRSHSGGSDCIRDTGS